MFVDVGIFIEIGKWFGIMIVYVSWLVVLFEYCFGIWLLNCMMCLMCLIEVGECYLVCVCDIMFVVDVSECEVCDVCVYLYG